MFEFLIELVANEREKYKEDPEHYNLEEAIFQESPDHQLSYDQVNCAMAKLIKKLGSIENISPQTKLVIQEDDANTALYMWTSAMLLGSLLLHKFDVKSIAWNTALFDPKNQMGWLGSFSNTSLYETEFKKELSLGQIEWILGHYKGIAQERRVEKEKQEAVLHQKRIAEQREQELVTQKKKQERIAAKNKRQEEERAAKLEEERAAKQKLQEELAKEEEERSARQRQEELAAKRREERAAKKKLEEQKQAKDKLIKEKSICLLNAICEFDTKISNIETFLFEGADLDYQDNSFKDGYTALMLAINVQNEPISVYLLKKGANPCLVNKHGQTAMDLVSDNTYTFELMTQKIKEIELDKMPVTARATKALCNEICSVDPKIQKIKLHLEQGADINYNPDDGYPPLMLAVDSQNDRIVEYLLHEGANPCLANKHGQTAMDFASHNTYIFELMTQKVKEIELQKMSVPARATKALCDEISSVEPKTQKIKHHLTQGADINFRSNDGYTPLMIAVDNQNDRIVEYLLYKGADPRIQNSTNELASDLASRNSLIFFILKGYELLHAVLNGELATVKTLLRNGGDINFQGLGGYTPILIAVDHGAIELVDFLLANDADLTLTRRDGQGVLELVNENDQAMLELLLEQVNRFDEGEDEVDQTISSLTINRY